MPPSALKDFRQVPIDRTVKRREKLRKTFKNQGVDGLLVASVSNVRYLTGFSGEDSTFLLTGKQAVLISDGRYTTQLDQECPGLDVHIRPVGQQMVDGITEVVGKVKLKRLGLEAESVSLAEFEALNGKLKAVALRPVSQQVESLRALKDEDEIEATREAIAYAERAFAMVRAGLGLDQSEKNLADDLDAFMRRCGASSASFPPIVAVGAHAALPHYRPSAETRVRDDDFVLIDWGATGTPYKSDLTRVLVTGKVTSKFAKVYRVVLAAQERGIAAIRPGVKARDVDAEARSVIEEAGFGRFFDHGLGHGLGMEIHEAPRLRRESEDVLQPGMIVTVEPGVYLPGWGGIRIEDDVLVTPGGHEVLSHVPKSLESVHP